MTARREIELSCDGLPGRPFDCETAPIFHSTVQKARREAHREGWITKIRASKVVDLCSQHKTAPPLAKSRGNCTVCGRECEVGITGLIRSHKMRNPDGSYQRYADRCPGFGKPPAVAGETGQEAGRG